MTCPNCKIRLTLIVYRPTINGKTKYIKIGEICKQCKKYKIEIKEEVVIKN